MGSRLLPFIAASLFRMISRQDVQLASGAYGIAVPATKPGDCAFFPVTVSGAGNVIALRKA
jgi:hypothetical protein